MEKHKTTATERIQDAARAADRKKREKDRERARERVQREQEAEQGQGKGAGGVGIGAALVTGYVVGRVVNKPAPAPEFRGFLREQGEDCDQDQECEPDAAEPCAPHEKHFDAGTQRVRGGHEPDFGD